MRIYQSLHAGLKVLFVAIVVFVLASCERAERVNESAATLEAELMMTVSPQTSPAATETTAEPTSTAEPTAEPTSTAAPPTTVTDMEEYVSTTDFFRVKVPAGWSSEESFPGGAFVMANSMEAFGRFGNDDAIESGDLILNIGFLPFELFRQREVVPLEIQFGATPDVFMQSVLPIFRVSGDAVVGDVELVSLDDEHEAGMLTVSDGNREGLILMFVAGDEVVAIVSAVGFPGEVDGFQETIFAIASGVTFSGAQGALYGALLEG